MSDRIPPENLLQGTRVLAMIGNMYCVRAVVSRDVNWDWVAEPTTYARAALLRSRINMFPWRYLTNDDEGVFWVRGWSRKSANALKVAASLALR